MPTKVNQEEEELQFVAVVCTPTIGDGHEAQSVFDTTAPDGCDCRSADLLAEFFAADREIVRAKAPFPIARRHEFVRGPAGELFRFAVGHEFAI